MSKQPPPAPTASTVGPCPGRAAFYIMSENKSFTIKLNPTLSVFSAELTAIKAALIWLKARHQKISEAAIFTDSLSSIQALKSGSSKSRPDLVNHILKLLDETTTQGQSIQIEWIPAHVGIPGNEMADSKARLGSEDGYKLST